MALQHFELPRLLQQHSQPEPAPCTSLPVPFFFHFSFLSIHVRALHRNFVLVFFLISLFIFSINNSTLHKPSCSCLFSLSQELLLAPYTSLPVLVFFHFHFSFSLLIKNVFNWLNCLPKLWLPEFIRRKCLITQLSQYSLNTLRPGWSVRCSWWCWSFPRDVTVWYDVSPVEGGWLLTDLGRDRQAQVETVQYWHCTPDQTWEIT